MHADIILIIKLKFFNELFFLNTHFWANFKGIILNIRLKLYEIFNVSRTYKKLRYNYFNNRSSYNNRKCDINVVATNLVGFKLKNTLNFSGYHFFLNINGYNHYF